eukprot:COSAG06_NODE_330_length_17413_cov_12.112510_20_plen_83_part_00
MKIPIYRGGGHTSISSPTASAATLFGGRWPIADIQEYLYDHVTRDGQNQHPRFTGTYADNFPMAILKSEEGVPPMHALEPES